MMKHLNIEIIFVKLAKDGFYDGLLFHRVIKEFMIQGGDPDSKNAKPDQMLGSGGLDYRIDAEFNKDLIHQKGALAAARDNNPDKASSSCQFYIVAGKKFTEKEVENFSKRTGAVYTPEQVKIYEEIGGTPHLDNGYTVFGQVTKGLDIVDKIQAVATNKQDRPTQDVHIKKVKVKKKFLFFWI
ncbi:MAG: peptidylprolyl isomerase [Taibaiella sp.]|nr:peptidylprolyl isomerase [Taibaiella sp.]